MKENRGPKKTDERNRENVEAGKVKQTASTMVEREKDKREIREGEKGGCRQNDETRRGSKKKLRSKASRDKYKHSNREQNRRGKVATGQDIRKIAWKQRVDKKRRNRQ